ncbi:uncharacterized protein EI90DRAFT_1759167 [Cantharellus anzutake]|uniref:uncharacterized protein n=1 Tax=Cantharellus anzutake TaxID=1750568 RepID=UPI001903AB59|nr:uncharacterized protein EI90DRAFT_1759167 [Cantharellus anzutake]KAF8341617.1 hypothetical protein EI90DRAFT_1759167 [Cantharellus anzutake]
MGANLRPAAAVSRSSLVVSMIVSFKSPSDLRCTDFAGTDEVAVTDDPSSCCMWTLGSSLPMASALPITRGKLVLGGDSDGRESFVDVWTEAVGMECLDWDVLDWFRRLGAGRGLLRNGLSSLSRKDVRCSVVSSCKTPLESRRAGAVVKAPECSPAGLPWSLSFVLSCAVAGPMISFLEAGGVETCDRASGGSEGCCGFLNREEI